jgi:integrase
MIVSAMGKKEIWKSLKTDSYQTAVKRSYGAMALIEAQFESARSGVTCAVNSDVFQRIPIPSTSFVSADVVHAISKLLANGLTKTPDEAINADVDVGITLGEVYDLYIADPRHSWSPRTKQAYRTTRRYVCEAFGEKTPIRSIAREDCRQFVTTLCAMPRHANNKFPKLQMKEAIEAAAKAGGMETISVANVNAYLNKFCSFMNWCVTEEYIDKNPSKGLRVPDLVKKRDKRKSFTTQQLRRIFNAPLYTGCQDDSHGYAKIGTNQPKRARFWVPIIALFTGMRLNEICQLDVADVMKIDGYDCFSISESVADQSDIKRLKTASSERIVPVHEELKRIGFMTYVNEQKRSGSKKLFPEILATKDGYRSVHFSKWFSRFLETCEASEKLTCFHSFRHNFRDAMRNARISKDLALPLGGWTSSSDGSPIADNYGSVSVVRTFGTDGCVN